MKGLLREPLVHFLLGGLALFLLYGAVAGPAPERSDRIVISEDRVAMLLQTFERTWMRPPTEAEREGLIEDYVTEEILHREALALGLDRDDLIVRRRMRQKMEFLNEGLTEREPTDAELETYLAENPDAFREPERVTLVQVFVRPDAEGDAGERVAAVLTRLRDGADPAALGDSSLLPRQVENATPSDLTNSFGPAFAQAVAELPEGEWQGPVPSSFGEHLVRISAREASHLPELEEIRPLVAREWGAKDRRDQRNAFYQKLRERYEIEVRLPVPATADASS